RRAELEEERREVGRAEATSGGWTPKVHLVEIRPPEEEIVPALVGDGDCAEHVRGAFAKQVRLMGSVRECDVGQCTVRWQSHVRSLIPARPAHGCVDFFSASRRATRSWSW